MVQPLLVSISALTLATETVRSILKIDDVVRLNNRPATVFASALSRCDTVSILIFYL